MVNIEAKDPEGKNFWKKLKALINMEYSEEQLENHDRLEKAYNDLEEFYNGSA